MNTTRVPTDHDNRVILSLPKSIQGWAYNQWERLTENWDQLKFVYWLQEKGLKYTMIPNNTWTKSIQQKLKNTALGLRPGLCDLLIVVPQNLSIRNKAETVWIEMKRQKGGTVSPHQKEWIAALKEAGQHVFVCKGADVAIETLEKFLKT